MELNALLRQIPDFGKWSPTDQIKLFAWYVHAEKTQDRFSASDIRDCFDQCGMAIPRISALIDNLLNNKKPTVLRHSGGFRLERSAREELDSRYGKRAITVDVDKTLRELPAKLPDLAEREYLVEALTCFAAGAFRAAIVMCWSVAYDHLCEQIVKKKLAIFNAQMATQFPKEKTVVGAREDFYEFNESRVLEVGRSAGILDKNVYAVLDAALKTRNRAAHASGSTFKQPQAENYILELFNNAILKL